MNFTIILALCCLSVVISEGLAYSYATKYIDVPLDHFSFTSNATFKLRYLINDTFHIERGPIFFYTGNEGDINIFAQNSGFMNDIAPQFNALLVFAEHRYYGTSLPFGNLSYTSPKYLGYLSSSQALADFVYLINELQKKYVTTTDLQKLPVVAFGGSYGGMLSAWLRMKYPGSVVGAIASSAPIWQFKGLTPCENFNRITTNVYSALGGNTCSETIKKSWKIIRSFTMNDTGKSELSKYWKLCSPLNTTADVQALIDWLTEIYVDIAMLNYPYPTNFLAELPAQPVRAFCSKVNRKEYNDNAELLKTIGEALEVYTNYTGKTKCNNINTTSASLGILGWDFQSCTEMIMPICSTNYDMFENQPWDFKKVSDNCMNKFGIRPRDEEVPILQYGGKDISSASNIIFSNGLYDPWSSGGVLRNIGARILAIVIPDGAHHFDLRGANVNDSSSVKAAREFHVHHIRRWIDRFYFDNLRDALKYEFYKSTS
nr:lysosomal Pro-X carboxypeptidase [Leptinotarsa decemlineata]